MKRYPTGVPKGAEEYKRKARREAQRPKKRKKRNKTLFFKKNAYLCKNFQAMKQITLEKLTPHFTMLEFFPNVLYVKKLNAEGGVNDGDFARICSTAEKMEKIREILGNKPITITSGYRTKEQNRIAGGAPSSYHLDGLAVDFFERGLLIRNVFNTLKADTDKLRQIGVYELIHYPNKGIVHISFQKANFYKPLKILTK